MSAPIDAIAVLDGTIEGTQAAARSLRGQLRAECEDALADLTATRTAFAELIKAGSRMTAAFRALGLDSSLINRPRLVRECEESMVAFDAALVCAQGGAA